MYQDHTQVYDKLNHAQHQPQTQVKKASRMRELRGPTNVPWCTPWNPTTPRYRTTTSQNRLTIPLKWGEGGTQKRERLQLSLPLGGGKLRCRDVLGLGSGRGSCLNPERGEGDQGMGRRWSKGSWLDMPLGRKLECAKGNVYSTGLWCWFQGYVILWPLTGSWL